MGRPLSTKPGDRVGTLTLLAHLPLTGKDRKVRLRCDCGAEIEGWHANFRAGTVRCPACFDKKRIWRDCGEMPWREWQSLHNNAAHRSKPIPILLTQEDAEALYRWQGRRCLYSGVSIGFDFRSKKGTTASPDRIDSRGPYSVLNLAWVHKVFNLMKGELSLDEFLVSVGLVAFNNLERVLRLLGHYGIRFTAGGIPLEQLDIRVVSDRDDHDGDLPWSGVDLGPVLRCLGSVRRIRGGRRKNQKAAA